MNHYSIASAIPLDSTISYSSLAAKLSLDTKQLRQMLRQLIQIHVFHEPSPNEVAHTASSKLLITHTGVAAFNAYISRDVFPMAVKQIEALEHFGHGSIHPHEAGLNFACGTDLPMYAYYESAGQSGVRERFSQLMTYVSSFPVMAKEHAGRGFGWDALPEDSVVVDVAGNVGHCSIPIARANPSVRIVVQDLPNIVARATDPATSVIPPDLRPRFTFQEHDFYAPQPVKHAAVYFLRMIMHDYSDAYCLRILRRIVPSMAPTSRIVIMDQVSPPVGVVPSAIERMMRTQDLQMMLLTNARERDAAEWTELIANVVVDAEREGEGQESADGEKREVPEEQNGEVLLTTKTTRKLEIKNIVSPQGSTMSLIEVGFVDGDAPVAAGDVPDAVA